MLLPSGDEQLRENVTSELLLTRLAFRAPPYNTINVIKPLFIHMFYMR